MSLLPAQALQSHPDIGQAPGSSPTPRPWALDTPMLTPPVGGRAKVPGKGKNVSLVLRETCGFGMGKDILGDCKCHNAKPHNEKSKTRLTIKCSDAPSGY